MESRRDAVLKEMQREGFGVGVHYPIPLHMQPAYRHLGYKEGQLPEAVRASGEVLSLPLYPEMTEEQARAVAEALERGLENVIAEGAEDAEERRAIRV